MNPTPSPQQPAWFTHVRQVPQVCFALVSALAFLVLVCWAGGFWWLGTFGGSYVPMAPSTALLLLILSGAGLWQGGRDPRAGNGLLWVSAGWVLAASLLLGAPHYFGSKLDLEALWVTTPEKVGGYPVGRMAPLTASFFWLASLAFMAGLAPLSRRRWVRQVSAVLATLLCLASFGIVLSYLLDRPMQYGGTHVPMAALTALCFLLVGLGVLVRAGEDTWPTRLFVARAGAAPVNERFGWGFVLLAVVTVAGLGVAGWFFYRMQQTEIRHGMCETLQAVADLKTVQISRWMNDRQNDAALALQTGLFAQFLEAPEYAVLGEDLRRWMNACLRARQYNAIELYNAQGELMLSAPDDVDPSDEENASLIGQVIQSGTNVFADLHEPRPGAPARLSILVPVGEGERGAKVNGVLAFHVDPRQFLNPLLQNWPTPARSAETLLVRREAGDVVYLHDLRHHTNAALRLRLPLERTNLPAVRVALGQEGVVEGDDYRGAPVVAALRPVPGTPWFLVAKVDQEEMYTPLRQQARLIGLLFGALMIAGLLGIGLLWHQRGLAFSQQELIERRQAEAVLRQSEEKYRLLVENAREAIYVAQDGKLRFVNAMACQLLEGAPDDIVGRSIVDWVFPEDQAEVLAHHERLLRGEITQSQREYRIRSQKGAVHWMIVNAVRITWNGHPATLNFASDITDRRRAEAAVRQLNAELEQRVRQRTAELTEANKELESFAYSVSHDLRAPLRGISGWSQALLEDYADRLDEPGRASLHTVCAEAQRMGDLIDAMLQLSRVTRSEMNREQVDLSQVAREIAAALQRAEPARAAEFVIAPGLQAEGDLALLRTALRNLMENAWKFTARQERTRIEVGLAEQDGRAAFFVRDNGAGFDKTYAAKLFTPFQRLHRVDEFPGTGIGLATVRRILQRHGGRIWAEGEKGRGATFFFRVND